MEDGVVVDAGTAPRTGGALAAACLGYLLISTNIYMVNTVIPSIGRGLHVGADGLEWTSTVFGIVFAGLLLTAGSIGDRCGRKRVLIGGFPIDAVGALLGITSS